MKAGDLVELATRNLRESVLRNSLTTLGIGVGVASLVAMLSLGIGLQELANRRLERSGLFDTIMVSSRRGFRGFERRAFGTARPPRRAARSMKTRAWKLPACPTCSRRRPTFDSSPSSTTKASRISPWWRPAPLGARQ